MEGNFVLGENKTMLISLAVHMHTPCVSCSIYFDNDLVYVSLMRPVIKRHFKVIH